MRNSLYVLSQLLVIKVSRDNLLRDGQTWMITAFFLINVNARQNEERRRKKAVNVFVCQFDQKKKFLYIKYIFFFIRKASKVMM